MSAVFESLRHFGVLWRHMTSIAVVLAAIWVFSGPFVKSYAADALLEILKEQGLDPQAVADVQKKASDIDKKTDDLATDNEKIKRDLSSVQTDVAVMKKDTSDIEKLLTEQSQDIKKLLRALGPGNP